MSEKNSQINSDEIDLLAIVSQLWSKRFSILKSVFFVMVVALVYSIVAPKMYKSSATFFPNDASESRQFSSYASLLGVQSAGNVSDLIKNVLGSYSLKEDIADRYLDYFHDEIQSEIRNEKLIDDPVHINRFVMARLDFKKNFSYGANKTNLFWINYISEDPELSQGLLSVVLEELLRYNEVLEFSASKQLITIIDSPSYPYKKYKPRLLFNVIMSGVFALFLSIIISLLYPFIANLYRLVSQPGDR